MFCKSLFARALALVVGGRQFLHGLIIFASVEGKVQYFSPSGKQRGVV
jgi:hypothetical protein